MYREPRFDGEYPKSFQYWLDAHQPIVWGLDLQEVGFTPYKSYVVLPRRKGIIR